MNTHVLGFLALLFKCTGRSGINVGVDKILKFYFHVFYVMGKGLSGELSCTLTGLVVVAA